VPQCRKLLYEPKKMLAFFLQIPIHPRDFIVLAVCIIVALLGSPNSSPATSNGVPWLNSSVANRLRICLARSALILGSSVGPSTPQFQEQLSELPSLLSSPFASLCFRV
jgi:hypothetical protein